MNVLVQRVNAKLLGGLALNALFCGGGKGCRVNNNWEVRCASRLPRQHGGCATWGVANFALAKLPAETLPFLVIGLHASLASRSAPNVREIDLLDYLMGETFQQQC